MCFCGSDAPQILKIIVLSDFKLKILQNILIFLLKHICKNTIYRISGFIIFSVMINFINEKQ